MGTPATPGTPGLLLSSAKGARKVDRSAVRRQLATLPEAQFDYESQLPEEEEDDKEGDETRKRRNDEEMDAEEIERQIREEEEALEREELARRSEVMKRSLPRGAAIPSRFFESCDAVETLLKQEINAIVRYEDFKYPTEESHSKYTREITLPTLSHEDQITAEMLILEEVGDLQHSQPPYSAAQLETIYSDVWSAAERDLAFDPETRSVVALSTLSEPDRIRCLRHRFSGLQKLVAKQTKAVAKSEAKLNVVLGGYQARQKALVEKINGLNRELDLGRINFLCFSKLAAGEETSREGERRRWDVGLAMRMKSVKESVKREKARHALLQKRYKELLRKTQELWFVCLQNRVE